MFLTAPSALEATMASGRLMRALRGFLFVNPQLQLTRVSLTRYQRQPGKETYGGLPQGLVESLGRSGGASPLGREEAGGESTLHLLRLALSQPLPEDELVEHQCERLREVAYQLSCAIMALELHNTGGACVNDALQSAVSYTHLTLPTKA